jgi:membrane protease subunit HflC
MSSKTGSKTGRLMAAGGFLIVILVLASGTTVGVGEAVVITRLGQPVRTYLEPGLYWRLPAPIERAERFDMRLRTTSSGRFDVQLRDAAILEVEAAVTWRVTAEADSVGRFLRAVGNKPEQAAAHLRGIIGSALQTASGAYAVDELLTETEGASRLEDFEKELARAVADRVGETYGIEVVQVGFERFMVPQTAVQTAIRAMIKEREVVAEQRRGKGLEEAGRILAEAEAKARQMTATAQEEAATLRAGGLEEAARIHRETYALDPDFYRRMRGLDLLASTLGQGSTLILRTDAWPLRYLADGPGAESGVEPLGLATIPGQPDTETGDETVEVAP